MSPCLFCLYSVSILYFSIPESQVELKRMGSVCCCEDDNINERQEQKQDQYPYSYQHQGLSMDETSCTLGIDVPEAVKKDILERLIAEGYQFKQTDHGQYVQIHQVQ